MKSDTNTNTVAAAFANAVYNAIGVRFKQLPITPEMVLEALAQRNSAGSGEETIEIREKELA